MHMLRQRCALSMLHRTCENVHGGVRLGGLGMPNIMYRPFYFKPIYMIEYFLISHIWDRVHLIPLGLK